MLKKILYMGKTKEIQQKNVVAETISALLLSKNVTEAAELLGLDRSTLYKRMEVHPEIGETLNKLSNHSLAILKAASVKAAEILVEGLNSRWPEKKIAIAKDILDRVGLSSKNGPLVQNVDVGGPTEIVLCNQQKNEIDDA